MSKNVFFVFLGEWRNVSLAPPKFFKIYYKTVFAQIHTDGALHIFFFLKLGHSKWGTGEMYVAIAPGTRRSVGIARYSQDKYPAPCVWIPKIRVSSASRLFRPKV